MKWVFNEFPLCAKRHQHAVARNPSSKASVPSGIYMQCCTNCLPWVFCAGRHQRVLHTDQSGDQSVTIDGPWLPQFTGVASATDQSGDQPVTVDGPWPSQSTGVASATDQSGDQPVTVDGPWLPQSTGVTSK